MLYRDMIWFWLSNFLAFWDYDCFQKNCFISGVSSNTFDEHGLSGQFEPTTFFFYEGALSNRPGCRSDLFSTYYYLIIKTTLSVHFGIVYTNLREQTTSPIKLVVLKRRILVVMRKDSRCLLLHRLEQHRRIFLSQETYRTLAQPADPYGNPFGDMV